MYKAIALATARAITTVGIVISEPAKPSKKDFLKMSLAYDGRIKKTIVYLQKIMPRSYPVDFPMTFTYYL